MAVKNILSFYLTIAITCIMFLMVSEHHRFSKTKDYIREHCGQHVMYMNTKIDARYEKNQTLLLPIRPNGYVRQCNSLSLAYPELFILENF